MPLPIHTVDSNTLMLINTLIELGATSQFIDIEYVQSKNLCTQCLPKPSLSITWTELLMSVTSHNTLVTFADKL